MWLYGSGFPKSMNVGLALDKKNGVDNRTGNIKTTGKATNSGSGCYNFNNGIENSMKKEYEERIAQNEWSGWGTCLKPAYEPIIVARKPFKGTLVDNIFEYGVGGINIDECRVGDEERFPANVILTYNDEDKEQVCGGMPNTKQNGSITKEYNANNKIYGKRQKIDKFEAYNDEGSASRYFYCAKASKRDRDEGLDIFDQDTVDDGRKKPIDNPFQRGETPRKNIHPTVKPTSLMQYLVRLVAPKGATILDPFMGSGSTGKATMYENKDRNANYKFIGIELTEEYLPIAEARIKYVENTINEQKTIEKKEDNEQISLF